MKTISTNKDQTKAVYLKLDQIKLVLSFLLTPGLNDDIDDICRTKLRIPNSTSSVGFSRYVSSKQKLVALTLHKYRYFDPLCL